MCKAAYSKALCGVADKERIKHLEKQKNLTEIDPITGHYVASFSMPGTNTAKLYIDLRQFNPFANMSNIVYNTYKPTGGKKII